jgi:hypothetical protein
LIMNSSSFAGTCTSSSIGRQFTTESCCAPVDPQPIAPDTTRRKGVKCQAVRPDAFRISIGSFWVGTVSNEIIDLQKIVLSFGCENDVTSRDAFFCRHS